MNHNAHIVLYKERLVRMAEFLRRPLAQLVHYTELQKEINPNWKP